MSSSELISKIPLSEAHLRMLLSDSQIAAGSPGAMAMYASRGGWRLYRHLALFNAIALAIAGGSIRNAIIEMPPQHGKSEFWSRNFSAWYIGTFPDDRVLLASYEADYAAGWGRRSRDILEEIGPHVFGIQLREGSTAADNWGIEGREGGMKTSGVDGPLTGFRGDVAIIDDAIKNAAEAESVTRKKHIWDWWESTLCTRMSKRGRRIVVTTRWAVDDLVGRILDGATQLDPLTWRTKGGETWTVLRLPAIADADEAFPQYGWTRAKGEPLCPELFPLEVLDQRRRERSPYWWATLYQQLPYPREGGQLKLEWLANKIVDEVPELEAEARSWDLAASEDPTAKRTAGVRIGRTADKRYFITDVVFGRWGPGERDRVIKLTADADGKDVHVPIEQEPGSGGKSQVQTIATLLDGWRVIPMSASRGGSKELRADGLASCAQSGRLYLKRGAWNQAFLEEWGAFPGGPTIDIVDSAAHGYNHVVTMPGRLVLPSLPGTATAPTGITRLMPPMPGRIFG